MTRTACARYHPRMRGLSHSFREVLAVAALPLLCVPAPGQRHEHKRVERAEITTLEAEWRQAQISDDIPDMDRLLAEDFLGITAGGQVVTKAQQLDRMRSRQIELHRLDLSDTKIKISGKLAVVTSLAQIEGTMEGRPVNGYFRYTRVYQRAPATGWRITSFEATRVPGPLSPVGSGITTPGALGAAPRAGVPSLLPTSRVELGSLTPRS